MPFFRDLKNSIQSSELKIFRYMNAGQSITKSRFEIPMADCGTSIFEEEASNAVDKSETKTGFSNIIIIQMDEEVQEIWDSARKINCEWVSLIKKHVEFQPFEVQMLDFKEVKFQGDSVECFMDLQAGKYPESADITEAVKIGEPLSLLVFAQDDEGMYDIHVKECFAYSSDKYDSNETVKLQLTDERGCVMKNKLLDGFFTAREPTENGGSKIVAYGYLSAFKFPDVFDVFTTCEVEICKGGCNDKCEVQSKNNLILPSVPIASSTTTPTTAPFREGVELFGGPISCDEPDTARIDPRCRQPKSLEEDLDCDNDPFNDKCPPDCLRFTEDTRCLPDCDLDPFNPKCPADCLKYSGEDPRCPVDCNKDPMNPKCPPDCKILRGKDERCPCSANPIHPNCTPDCANFGDKDPRCPPDCSRTPFHPRCPANCSFFAGQDPRCPCSDNPLSKNCPPDCTRFETTDPRCKPDCDLEPFHPWCPEDCDRYTGSDPRCPCKKNPLHADCPPVCTQNTEDPRCPPDCDRDPFNVRCPADCTRNVGKDPRCPCSQFPLHPSCPPDCQKFGDKDPRCPPDCNANPYHDKCEPNCELYTGKDPRCPCAKIPLHANCPENCKLFTGQDPRCPCSKDPTHFNCPPDCRQFKDKDPRCKNFCVENPTDPSCEGVELFGQPLSVTSTTITTTVVTTLSTAKPTSRQTTTKVPRTTPQTPRAGRQNVQEHHGHHEDHHHHHGDIRNHPFHSFHYDPGDGRRGRGKRLGRSISFEAEPISGRARLARHIKVVSPDSGVPQGSKFGPSSLDFDSKDSGLVCLTQGSFLSGIIVLLVLLVIVLSVLIFYCIRERRREALDKNSVMSNMYELRT